MTAALRPKGRVAEMLAELKLPFTGCPASALDLALDKARTKKLLSEAGIKLPDIQILTPFQLEYFQPYFSLFS